MKDKLDEFLNRPITLTGEAIYLIVIAGILSGCLLIMEWMGI